MSGLDIQHWVLEPDERPMLESNQADSPTAGWRVERDGVTVASVTVDEGKIIVRRIEQECGVEEESSIGALIRAALRYLGKPEHYP